MIPRFYQAQIDSEFLTLTLRLAITTDIHSGFTEYLLSPYYVADSILNWEINNGVKCSMESDVYFQ